MIQITPQMRILVAVEPVDFRKGIDGLAALCREALASDPLGGALFVFCSRRRHAIKILTYDGQGFWCAHRVARRSARDASSAARCSICCILLRDNLNFRATSFVGTPSFLILPLGQRAVQRELGGGSSGVISLSNSFRS